MAKKSNKSDRPKLVFEISDTHCGSDVGLRPPEVKLPNGNVNVIGESLHQQLLWGWWQEAQQWIEDTAAGRPFILLFNGDAIEGVHHGSKELIAIQEEIHVAIAIQTLKPIADRAATVLMVAGTECHTKSLENVIATKIGAREGIAKDKWLFTVNGVLNDAAHHMATTKRRWLNSGDLSRVMTNAIANYTVAGMAVPRVYWRAHRHVGGYFSENGYHIAVAGGWQFLTRYGHKVVTESIPSPSIQFMDFTDPQHITHKEKHFNEPQPSITEI